MGQLPPSSAVRWGLLRPLVLGPVAGSSIRVGPCFASVGASVYVNRVPAANRVLSRIEYWPNRVFARRVPGALRCVGLRFELGWDATGDTGPCLPVRGASLSTGAAAPASCSTPRGSRCGRSSGGSPMDLRSGSEIYAGATTPVAAADDDPETVFVLPLGWVLLAQYGQTRKRILGARPSNRPSPKLRCSKSSSAAGSVVGSPCADLDARTRTHRSAPGTPAAMPTAREESTKQGLARRDARPAPRNGKHGPVHSVAPHLIRRVVERIGVPSELSLQPNTQSSELDSH